LKQVVVTLIDYRYHDVGSRQAACCLDASETRSDDDHVMWWTSDHIALLALYVDRIVLLPVSGFQRRGVGRGLPTVATILKLNGFSSAGRTPSHRIQNRFDSGTLSAAKTAAPKKR
jgi:hypothetical protein